jgi:hypothetical protein
MIVVDTPGTVASAALGVHRRTMVWKSPQVSSRKHTPGKTAYCKASRLIVNHERAVKVRTSLQDLFSEGRQNSDSQNLILQKTSVSTCTTWSRAAQILMSR